MTSETGRFDGVFTALVTPFRDGRVDHASFEALVERQIAAGVAGLVPVGTTGEAATLSDDEAEELIRRTVALAAGRVMVVAGAGSNDSGKAAEKARRAEKAGADALLVVTPYYNKPTQAGLLRHYALVAEASALPTVLYSVPGRCGIEIAVETCAALRDRHPGIVAIKEAGGSVERVTRIRRACGADFVVHCGDDALTLPFLAAGAAGVTSVVSNYAPREVVAMVAAWHAGDAARALRLHEHLFDLAEGMFIEANPGPVKAALAMEGLAGAAMRAPMAAMEPQNETRLAGILERFRARAPLFQEMR